MSGQTPKFPARSSIQFRDKSFPLLQTRPYNSLSLDTLEAIKLITLDQRYPPNIVGSYKYIVHEYPADIDMFESYESCCKKDEAALDVENKFKQMAKNIKETDNVYLGDFKAGYDNRYKINIGYVTTSGELSHYEPLYIRKSIINLFNKGLLTKEEKDEWLFSVIDHPTLQEYMDLEDKLRSKLVVRWSLDEMIKGVKILPLGVELLLKDAVTQKSIVKIDIWIYLNNRYIEMTNWYLLLYKDNQSKKVLNLSIKPERYQTSLIKDLYYYNNPSINKYMKLAKRLWLYAVMKKDKSLMYNLYPLFSSGAAKMYQIIGEIDTIKMILKRVDNPNLLTIIRNIEDWKTRLGTVMSDILPIQVAHTIYTKINDIIANKNDKESIQYSLDEIHDKLNQYVNRYVKLYFKRNRINVAKLLKTSKKDSN